MTHSVNLVPVAFRRRLLLRRRLRQWAIVWILAIFALASACAAEYAWILHQQRILADLQTQCDPLRQIDQATQHTQQQLEELRSRESLFAALQRHDRPVQLLGLVGVAAYGTSHDIHIDEFRMTTSHSSGPAGRSENSFPTEKRLLHLAGRGVDALAVARFVSHLRETEAFESVMLRSSMDLPGPMSETCQFEVACEYH